MPEIAWPDRGPPVARGVDNTKEGAMKNTLWIAGATLAIAFAARADDRMKNPADGKPMSMGKSEAVFVNAKDLKWVDNVPDVPKGMQMTVLYGDPSKAGPCAARIK